MVSWAFPAKLVFDECHGIPLIINIDSKYEINIDSGNSLMPSGNKPLPESMLTQIYVAICRHQATMSLIAHTSSNINVSLLLW